VNILSRIIYTTIFVSLLIILLFVTYLTSTYTDSKLPYYEKISTWSFEIKNNNGIFAIDNLNNESGTWNFYVKIINPTDKIYYSSWNIEFNENNWVNNINISPWFYYFDIKNIDSDYLINWSWFIINNKWPWAFFVNSLNPTKNIILSMNSLLNLNLINIKNNEKINNLDVYPHTYLTFNLLKNGFIKTPDLLKIFQTFTLWYYNNQIAIQNEIPKDFLDMMSSKNKEKEVDINNFISITKQNYNEMNKIYNKFTESSFITLPGEDFILKYSVMFVNSSKISTFNKNVILKNLYNLVISDELDPILINKIIADCNSLRKIDEKWFEQMKDIITYYYKIVLSSNNSSNSKINLTNLYMNLNNKNTKIKSESLIFLGSIFFNYDFLSSEWFYKDISNFKKDYFDLLKLDLKWSDENYSIDKIENIDYLLFFLENIIVSSNFSSSINDTKNLIDLFNDYVIIASSFYKISDEKIKRTWIFTNYKILNKFLTILKDKYFEKDRNENKLLVIKNDQEIINEDISILNQNTNELINFFENQKKILDPYNNTKDKIIIKQYENISERYKEYFSALSNYEEYKIKFDKNKTKLLDTDTINENDNNLVLSQDTVKEFLNKFSWLNLSNTIINIMDYNYCMYPVPENEISNIEIPYCYKIENLNVDWNNISFLIYPFEKNKIDEIIVESIKSPWSYKLDELKTILDEKYKIASENRERYNFYNFFINTFWQKTVDLDYENSNDTDNTDIELVEDSIVKIFKRNKLLWNSWDFSSLKGFLDINYNDLIVENKSNWEYSIFINKSLFTYELEKDNEFYWYFSSNYDFSNKHSFIDPELILLDNNNNNTILLWNKISITWEYKVDKMQEEIKDLFDNYEWIDFITSYLSNNINQNIKIDYIKSLNQVIFETIYNWKALYINLNNWYITKLTYNDENYLSDQINYLEIYSILENIKK